MKTIKNVLAFITVTAAVLSFMPITIHADNIVITDLQWNKNDAEDPFDDTLTFTAPAGYDTISSSTDYKYYLNKFETTIVANNLLLSTDNSTIDSATRKVTINLKQDYRYGTSITDSYAVILNISNGSTYVTSNSVKNDYSLTKLDAPTNLHYSDNQVSYSRVFGANSYEITHFNKNNEIVETLTDTSETWTHTKSLDASKTAEGDIISVIAKNDTLSSAASTCTVSKLVNINDLSWNTNGTDNEPIDDVLTFTMPEGYRKLTYSDDYHYEIRMNGNSDILSTENSTMDSSTGVATIELSKIKFYGYGTDLSYSIKLGKYVGSGTSIQFESISTSNIVSHKFTISNLASPGNLRVNGTTVYFDKVFGADSYTIKHYDKNNVLLETPVYQVYNSAASLDASKTNEGDIITVEAKNSTFNLTSGTVTYTIKQLVSISDLTWNTNNTDNDPMDDTLLFTAPQGYYSTSNQTYAFMLEGTNEGGELYGTQIVIDSTTGKGVINLAKIEWYGSSQTLTYKLSMYSVDTATHNIGDKICESNSVSKTFTIDSLSIPTITSVANGSIKFTRVFGANNYDIKHYNKDNALIETITSYNNYTHTASIDESKVNTGDVFTVVAMNTASKLTSETAKYTIGDYVHITDLTWHDLSTVDPEDDTLTFTMPEGYRSINDYSKYYYTVDDGHSNSPLTSNNTKIDAVNGIATIHLSNLSTYGVGADLTYCIKLNKALQSISNDSAIATSNKVNHKFAITKLDAPTNICFGSNAIRFEGVFGATSYNVEHFDKDNNSIETLTSDGYAKSVNLDSTKSSAGDYVTVTANNASLNLVSESTKYTIDKIITISDLLWNTNNSADPIDDTLTFTMPEGYRSARTDGYFYELLSKNEDVFYGSLSDSNVSIDSEGHATVKLSNVYNYGKSMSYDIKVQLYADNGNILISLAKSNSVSQTFAITELSPAKNLKLTGNYLTFDKVFGAEKYEITHYGSDGTLKETFDTTTQSVTLNRNTIAIGDSIKVVASNESSKLTSSEATYSVTKLANYITITGIEISGAEQIIHIGEPPVYQAKVKVTGTGTNDSIYSSIKLIEFWDQMDTDKTTILNRNSSDLSSSDGFNVFEAGQYYQYGISCLFTNTEDQVFVIDINNADSITVNGKHPSDTSIIKSSGSSTISRCYIAGITAQLPQLIQTTLVDGSETGNSAVDAAKAALKTNAPEVVLSDSDILTNINVVNKETSTATTVKEVNTTVDVTDADVNLNNEITSLTLNIDVSAKLVNENGAVTQSVDIHEIKNAVEIKLALPDNFIIPESGKLNIIHTLNSGEKKNYVGNVTIENNVKYVTFVNTDGFSSFQFEPYISVTSLELDSTSLSLTTGGTAQIGTRILPKDATNLTVSWASDNVAVATVDANGKVTGIAPGAAVITASVDDGSTKATCTVNVGTPVQGFVYRLYKTILDREPDTTGLNDWTKKLEDGSMTGSEVANSFIFSDEFKNKNYCNKHFVKHLYNALLGRDADEEGLKNWTDQLNHGASRESIVNGFLQGGEFTQICYNFGITRGNGVVVPAQGGTIQTGPCIEGDGMDGLIQNFAARMYTTCLGRQYDENIKNWINALYNGVSGSTVAQGFFFSDEFKNNNYCNKHFVKRLYLTLMNRDADDAGLKNWTTLLNNGASRESIMNGFIESQEFTKLCADYGIARGDGMGVPLHGTVQTAPCKEGDGMDGEIQKFAARLYTTCLGRSYDTAGIKGWIEQLNNGASGSQVAHGFFFSDEIKNQNLSDGELVTRMYHTFFDREPDESGYAQWQSLLKNGMSREELFSDFSNSQEWFNLCAVHGITK